MSPPVLSVMDLTTEFRSDGVPTRAVDGLSFDLHRGEALGLVGESGCGKSTAALAILGLVPDPPGRVTSGRVLLDGEDLRTLHQERLRRVRGRRIGMVFQEPASALNPVLTVGSQLAEVLRTHLGLGRADARQRAVEGLARAGIPSPATCYGAHPHQLSGGMRQRVLLAIATACEPEVLIADEPTTALDVTIQAQILELLLASRKRTGMALLFISHDLAVVASVCDRALVLLGGREVESGATVELFASPLHPYTEEMVRVTRVMEGEAGAVERARSATRLGAGGCVYAPRCARASERCTEAPRLVDLGGGRRVRCHHPSETQGAAG